MEHIVREFLKTNQIDLKGKTICVAVSCGVDSSVLLHLLESLKDELLFNIVICHVNHGQREQSNEEEKYIKEYGMNHKLTVEVKHFTNDMFKNKNFQSEARNLRIEFFKETMEKYNSKYIFLAHHLKDDIETSIMHMIRGSSLASYAGMREITNYKGITILRPLLKVLKEDIYKYAQDNNITYFEDSSNETNHYARNRIRHDIIPVLFEENNNFIQSFLLFKERINNSSILIQKQRDDYIDNFVKKTNNKNICLDLDSFKNIKTNELTKEFMQKEILFELLKKYYLSLTQVNEIIKIVNSNRPNIKIEFNTFIVTKEYNELIIQEKESKQKKQDIFITINDIGIYDINDKYMLEVVPFTDEDVKKNKNILINSNVLWYNSSMFPFILRNRRNGDKITVGNGTKKVKDLLIDEKIPLSLRDNFLLLTKDEEVLTIFNLRKSSKVLCSKNNNILFILKEKTNEFN